MPVNDTNPQEEDWEVQERIDSALASGDWTPEMLSEFVYESVRGGKKIYDLTADGIVAVALSNGIGIDKDSFKWSETETYYIFEAYAFHKDTGQGFWGIHEEPKFESKKDGKKVRDPFAIAKACKKAQRNACKVFVSAKLKTEAIALFVEQSKGQPKVDQSQARQSNKQSQEQIESPKPAQPPQSQDDMAERARLQARQEAGEAYGAAKDALDGMGLTGDVFNGAVYYHFQVGTADEMTLRNYRHLKDDLTDGFASWIHAASKNIGAEPEERIEVPTAEDKEEKPDPMHKANKMRAERYEGELTDPN